MIVETMFVFIIFLVNGFIGIAIVRYRGRFILEMSGAKAALP